MGVIMAEYGVILPCGGSSLTTLMSPTPVGRVAEKLSFTTVERLTIVNAGKDARQEEDKVEVLALGVEMTH
jgi:hypothetical protein